MLKSECRNFLSKLKNFNGEKVGIDDELIKILYEMTIVIDDYYALNQMMDIAPNGNAAETNAINSKGSQMLCDVCNVKIFFFSMLLSLCFLLLRMMICLHFCSTRYTSAAQQKTMPYMRRVDHIN